MLKKYPVLTKVLAALLAALLGALTGNQVAKGAEPEQRFHTPLTLKAETAPAACFQVQHGNAGCSCTCIASENGKSLLITCNHCFSTNPNTDGRYPTPCVVLSLDGRTRYPATAVGGSARLDMALVVVATTLPSVGIDGRMLDVGEAVEHWGICSHHTTGHVLALPKWSHFEPTDLFRSTCGSCPGDSGAGVFHDGRVVAINWGYWGNHDQAGTPIAFVGELVSKVSEVSRVFPGFAASVGNPPGNPPQLPPVEMQPPVSPPSACPPCPPTRQPRFPRLLPRLRGLR